MNKQIFLFLIINVLIISCSRNNQNSVLKELSVNIETEKNNKIFENIENYTQIDLPKIMFVNSKDGLRIRTEPSISGDVSGILIYGERIVAHEKSENLEIIDGITDYWYRLNRDLRKTEWIFGGYLSEKLPSDLPIILGKWDNVKHSRQYVRFLPNHDYSKGRKEAGYGIWGSWEINGNIIKTFNLRPSDDYIVAHGGDPETGKKIEPLKDEHIQLKIIDYDNIVLIFSENNIYFDYSDDSNLELTLKRCEDFW
jgi:hypothetical protein